MSPSEKSKERVLFLLDALNCEDFESPKECFNSEFTYTAPLGETEGGQNYLDQMEHSKFKFRIMEIFANEDDVCVIYDIDMGLKSEINSCGIYKFNDGKLQSLQLFFDPRLLLKSITIPFGLS